MRQQLSDGIEDYLSFRSSMGLAKRSLGNERTVLRAFLNVNGNIWIDSIGERHVTRHFEEAARSRQAQTLKLDHTYLGQFFEWARKTKRMKVDHDPMYGRRLPKAMQRERERIHVSKFPALLDVAQEQGDSIRALTALFVYTLLRDQEAANLRIRDVDLDGGWLRATIYKSGVQDRLPICSELDRELRVWLTKYAQECGELQPHWFLIPARKVLVSERNELGRITGHQMGLVPERKIKRSGVYVQPILERFGVASRKMDGDAAYEGAHTLRRSGARALFDSLSAGGYDHGLRVVQAMLHHKSVTQTERYIGLEADRRTRDEIIRGKQMYVMPEVTTLRVAH